jgi:hypothetical protein
VRAVEPVNGDDEFGLGLVQRAAWVLRALVGAVTLVVAIPAILVIAACAYVYLRLQELVDGA